MFYNQPSMPTLETLKIGLTLNEVTKSSKTPSHQQIQYKNL